MEFILIFFIFPILSFIGGVLGQSTYKRPFAVLGVIFLLWIMLTIRFFSSSFFVWVIINTLFSGLGVFIVHLKQK